MRNGYKPICRCCGGIIEGCKATVEAVLELENPERKLTRPTKTATLYLCPDCISKDSGDIGKLFNVELHKPVEKRNVVRH